MIHRRQWLSQSLLGGLPLSLAGLLWARTDERTRAQEPMTLRPLRACVLVFYYGGPSHIDTFDMKPEAGSEIRGPFRAISTAVPGVRVCEHLPTLARVMDRVAVIRSMHHANRSHDSASIETLTGHAPPGGDRELFAPTPQFFPCHGAAVRSLWRRRRVEVSHAALPWVFHNVVDVPCQGGGFLGPEFDPLRISGDLQKGNYRADSLSLPAGLRPARVDERRSLRRHFSRGPWEPADIRQAERFEAFYKQAYSLLEAEWFREALDVEREDDKTRTRYGLYERPAVEGGVGAHNAAGAHLRGQNLLLARRLVEAGVPFVNVYDYRQQGQNWDTHADNFRQHADHLLPPADRALSALISDLEERGLLADTLVVALGEFGRTPRINSQGGRDHWPDCYSAVLAGGGVAGGTLYGSSDRQGAYPERDPVTPGDLAATIFWRFGLNPHAEIRDRLGRPHRLSDGRPLRELFV